MNDNGYNEESSGAISGNVGSYDSHDNPVTDWRVTEMDDW